MQAVFPGQDSVLRANVVAISDGLSAIVAGTVNFYLVAMNGANVGQWWDAENEEWAATKASAGEATYLGGAVWTLEVDGAAFSSNIYYTLYWEESGDLHKPDSDSVYPMSIAYDGTIDTSPTYGVIELCNYALSILTGAINQSMPFLDTWDEEAVTGESLTTLRWFKICYPRARNMMQTAWEWPECTKFPLMGASLDEDSAETVPGYTYCYSKPSDCLAFRGIVGNQVNENSGEWREYPFLEVGQQIACNINNDDDDPQYYFRYTALVENTAYWSEELRVATAHLLALYICRSLGATLDNQMVVRQLCTDAFTASRAACQNRQFNPRSRLAQSGSAPELAPGIIDWSFPQPS